MGCKLWRNMSEMREGKRGKSVIWWAISLCLMSSISYVGFFASSLLAC